LDDTARIYKSGNPFKRDCTFELVCTTESELEDFASKLTTPDSPSKASASTKKSPRKVTDQSNERRLQSKLRSFVPELGEGEQRLQEMAKQRANVIKSREKRERLAAEAAAEEAAALLRPPPVVEKEVEQPRTRARRVNYADIEDGIQSTGQISECAQSGLFRGHV
jgi:hypothetical protein